MKRLAILFIVIFLVTVYAQQIINNPKTPRNKNAGRVLQLNEVMRISGEGENYYYNGANELQIDKSGNIYICDFWHTNKRAHLPKFSPDGRFINDLYKQGEGPGEIQSAFDFAISESEVYVYDYMKRKIIVMEEDGKFVKEFKLKSDSFSELIGIFEEWLLFLRKSAPYERKTSRLYDVRNVIVFVSKDGKIEKDFATFLSKQFFISSAQGGGSMSWDPFISVIANDKLFVCHSQEYLIEVLDLKSGKIILRFKRKYPRVKHELQKWEKDFASRFNAPKKKFKPDINDLLYNHGYLWVKTSTEDEKKGFLFDLYDTEARFLDSFFINVKGRIVKIDGDFLYSSETDEDYLPYVAKYRIAESLGTE